MSGQSRKIATANARRVRSTVQRTEQDPYRTAPGRRAPRLGAGPSTAWCRLSSPLGAATGTWPSITPTSQAGIDVYVGTGSTPVKIGTFTVYNYRAVAWVTGKTTSLAIQQGGWNVVDQDC